MSSGTMKWVSLTIVSLIFLLSFLQLMLMTSLAELALLKTAVVKAGLVMLARFSQVFTVRIKKLRSDTKKG